jgi:hypothetical protein
MRWQRDDGARVIRGLVAAAGICVGCGPTGSPDGSAGGEVEPRSGGLCDQEKLNPPSATCGNAVVNGGELCYSASSSVTAPNTATEVHLLVADFDGDEDVDILTENSVFRGNGNGGFSSAIQIPQVAGPVLFYVQGFKNDEFAAYFVGLVRSRPTTTQPDVRNLLYGYTLNSSMAIVERTVIGELGKYQLPLSLAVADYDEDEYAEFALEIQPEHSAEVHVRLFELGAGGALTSSGLGRSAPRLSGTGILGFDADDEGDIDLLTRSALFRNDGGNTWTKIDLPRDAGDVATFFAANFDCAGIPAGGINAAGIPFKLYETRSGGSSAYTFVPTGVMNEFSYDVLAAALLNEDKAYDLLVVGDSATYVVLGNGAIAPTIAPIQLTATRWLAADVEDLDDDGDAEIVATDGSGTVAIWGKNP